MKTKRMNKLPRTIIVLFIALLLSGCLFPVMWSKTGYGISINVPIIHKDLIASIQNTLRAEEFELKTDNDYKWKREFTYNKYVAAAFKKVEDPYIHLTLSYETYEKGQTAEQVTSFQIGMGNMDGQQTQLKQEMDRIADIMVSVLRGSVGEENITVERKATPGRPF
jgi:hypothetical protein